MEKCTLKGPKRDKASISPGSVPFTGCLSVSCHKPIINIHTDNSFNFAEIKPNVFS